MSSTPPTGVLGIDQRGIPTHACQVCGGTVFTIFASFEDYEIVSWWMDAECAQCGSPLTAPCPADRPIEEF